MNALNSNEDSTMELPSDAAASMQVAVDTLEAKINAILPPRYVGCFEDVPADSMGSATLKYDKDGKVAWGAIWTTFCHLALAGGPPHRGRFLGACAVEEAVAHPVEQAAVVAEIKRAIHLSTELPTLDLESSGWIGIRCHDEDMAAWMVRAIVAENVIARHDGNILYVPAGPHFRVEKEIKNVVVCVAKTCHYLLDHVEPEARPRGLARDLLQPPLPEEIRAEPLQYRAALDRLRNTLVQHVGLDAVESESDGWIGLQCTSEEMAIWLQRAVVVENILARREGEVLFLPVGIGNSQDTSGDKLAQVVRNAVRLWQFRVAARTS